MCVLRVFSFVLLLVMGCLNSQGVPSGKNFSKLELSSFAHSFVGEKINTRDFNIIVEKISAESSAENSSLSGAEVRELTVSPDQRDFEMAVKLKSGDQLTFSGKIEWLAQIPVLLRPIGAGEIINVSDVGYQSYPVDQLNVRVVTDARELIGKASSHSVIKPGLPVEKSILKNPIIVKKGEIIEVVYRSQHLQVSAKARSTQDLASGDTGTFETQSENAKQAMKKIAAKVIGPNTAEIIYGIA